MKSKIEKKLDEEFELLGIRPRIYHFRDLSLFNAITIATVSDIDEDDFWSTFEDINRSKSSFVRNHPLPVHDGSYVLQKLTMMSYGVALCDLQDQFNRRLGRVIAKGRLLKICRSWKEITQK